MDKKALLGLFLSSMGVVVAVGCASGDGDGSGGSGPSGSGAGTSTGTTTTTTTDTGMGGGGGAGGGTGGGTPSGDCVTLCEEGKACPDGDPNLDCNADCAERSALNQMSGCADEYDIVTACVSTYPDICNLPQDACMTEVENYSYCILEYCNMNPQSCP